MRWFRHRRVGDVVEELEQENEGRITIVVKEKRRATLSLTGEPRRWTVSLTAEGHVYDHREFRRYADARRYYNALLAELKKRGWKAAEVRER